MPHYRITTKDEEKPRWVKATSAAAAIRHCAEGRYSAETMQNVEDAADMGALGVKMEIAGEAQPQGEPEKIDGDGDGDGASGTKTPPNDDPPEEVRKQRANAKHEG